MLAAQGDIVPFLGIHENPFLRPNRDLRVEDQQVPPHVRIRVRKRRRVARNGPVWDQASV